MSDIPRADVACCLYGIDSKDRPKCLVLTNQGEMMSKKDNRVTDFSEPGACAGKSLVEMMEDTLDGLFVYLMQTDMEMADPLDVESKKGEALGVAKCIAIIKNPYYPDVTAVRADAVRRYEYRHGNEKDEGI